MKQLVFIHGRSQEGKDSITLKAEWVGAWTKTVTSAGRQIPIADANIRFPFYGDTLYELVKGVSAAQAAQIVIRGPVSGAAQQVSKAQQEFAARIIMEIADQSGFSSEEIADAIADPAVQRGLLNWKWVQGVLRVLDKRDGSGTAVALFTNDVYQYLKNPAVQKIIDDGVSEAINPGVETVVVAHSLGTIVAYRLLTLRGAEAGWKIPLFITLGSPLAVTAIKEALETMEHPKCVGRWFNAMDPRDVVSLYPLDTAHFPINPSIENKTNVDNRTSNRHGISGYLTDPDVAKRIFEALG